MRYVSYIRTSTKKQSLGLDAQRALIASVLGPDDVIVHEYSEQESGKDNERKALNAAMAHCRKDNCTLLVAKLDRLSRRMAFVATMMDDSSIEFKVAEHPHATRMMLHMYAMFAEEERGMISKRTKDALATIKTGVRTTKTGKTKLGSGTPENGAAASSYVRGQAADRFAACLAKKIDICKQAGAVSLRQIADKLNEMDVKTQRGGKWYAANLREAMLRLA